MRKKKTLEAALRAWQGIDQLNARIDPSRLDDHILGTYLYLRRIMTWLAILLPIVMVLGGLFGLFWSGRIEPQDSLSAYYHAKSLDPCSHHNGAYRDLFVGFLAAISVCLIAYRVIQSWRITCLVQQGFSWQVLRSFPWNGLKGLCRQPAKGEIRLKATCSLGFQIYPYILHAPFASLYYYI
jgi:hypothetical protein